MVDGHGPFLFALDPNASTMIDVEALSASRVIQNGSLFTKLHSIQIGDLIVNDRDFVGVRQHFLDGEGRRVYGVVGKEIVGDTLVFGFNRDEGVAWLVTQRAFESPAHALAIEYQTKVGLRRGPLVDASINGHTRELQVDLGRWYSRLRPTLWLGSELQERSARTRFVDDGGVEHTEHKVGTGHRVSLDGADAVEVDFTSFGDDPRYFEGQLDGTLALDFFNRFDVQLDRDHHLLYLNPRSVQSQSANRRLSRFKMPRCKHIGCVGISLDGKKLEVRPETSSGKLQALQPLQVVISARQPDGARLPHLGINFPSGPGAFAAILDDRYRDAQLEVIDASPFPRSCLTPEPCVVPIENLQATP